MRSLVGNTKKGAAAVMRRSATDEKTFEGCVHHRELLVASGSTTSQVLSREAK